MNAALANASCAFVATVGIDFLDVVDLESHGVTALEDGWKHGVVTQDSKQLVVSYFNHAHPHMFDAAMCARERHLDTAAQELGRVVVPVPAG